MGVSNWFLYIGIFLCATGFGVVVGAIFIFYWGIKKLEESKQGNSYTGNNYSVNIDHYHMDNDGTDNDRWDKPKAAVNENVPKNYASKETLEEGR